ncbi:MAG TPA: TonB-dependent receptor [Chitinophagaceae bacterium]
MKLLMLLFILTIVLPGSILRAQKQKHSAGGLLTVKEILNGSPVEGATILFLSSGKSTFTDEDGKFQFQKEDSIIISVIGFETRQIHITDAISSDHSIYLNRQVASLKAVTISPDARNKFAPITKTDIQLRGINNSQQVLSIVPGLFVGQHAGGGKAEQIFLRGFDIDHGTDINISVDGIPVNMVSHAHGQGYADLHFLIPELIEKVRFNKGPYYSEKGNLATAGFIDFRTKNVLSNNMVKLETGLFNTYRGVGLLSILSEEMEQKDQSAYIASEYMLTDGYFDNPQDFERINLFGRYYGKIGVSNTVTVSASEFRSRWNASGQIPVRAVNSGLITYFGSIDPNEGGITGRTNLNAIVNTKLTGGNSIRNQVFYTNYDFELYSNFTFFNFDSIKGDQIRQKEKRIMTGYNGSYTNVKHSGNSRFTSELGFFVRYDRIYNSELSRTMNRDALLLPLSLGDIKEINTAIYLDETVHFNERFRLNAGVRLDYFKMSYYDKKDNNKLNSTSRVIVNPKLNLYYHPGKTTQLYLSAGKGFHSNDTRVSVLQNNQSVLPAAFGTDLGVILKPGEKLLINAAVWHLFMEQEFVYVGDEAIVERAGRTNRTGIDCSIRYQPNRWLFIDADANYSYARATDNPKGKDHIPLAPVFTSAGGLTIKSGVINGSLRYRYMGNRPANEDNSSIATGYFINDLTLNYNSSRYEVGLTIHNLFDSRWKETQFMVESRLRNEPQSVSEIHFTPGTPFFIKITASYLFNGTANRKR